MTSNEERDDIDVGFDDAIMLEEHFLKAGVESGKSEAMKRCKAHGYQTGKEIGSEWGFYLGCVEAVREASERTESPLPLSKGAKRSLEKILVLLKDRPDSRVVLEKNENKKRLQLIRVKMKTLEKRLGWGTGSLRYRLDIQSPKTNTTSF